MSRIKRAGLPVAFSINDVNMVLEAVQFRALELALGRVGLRRNAVPTRLKGKRPSRSVVKKTRNPYGGPGERALAMVWDEGYEACETDDPCPGARPHNKGRHCDHWRSGDSTCCDCGKEIEVS